MENVPQFIKEVSGVRWLFYYYYCGKYIWWWFRRLDTNNFSYHYKKDYSFPQHIQDNKLFAALKAASKAKDWRKSCRKLIEVFTLADGPPQGEERRLMTNYLEDFVHCFKDQDVDVSEIRTLVRQKYKETLKKMKLQEIQDAGSMEQELQALRQIVSMEVEMQEGDEEIQLKDGQ